MDLSYWYFFILALFGAIVANATGAGGGVIFVPAFTILGLSAESIIATSFAIQCFGMTAGSVAWYRHAKTQVSQTANSVWNDYWQLVLLFSLPAIAGVLVGQYLINLDSVTQIRRVFKYFSVLFALSIFATTYFVLRSKRRLHQRQIYHSTRCTFMAIGFFGGVITAWLSIGVGELVAVMLILLRYPVRMAVGVAVTVSAICVWVGVQKYLWLQTTIDLNVLLFAAPAAIIGGTVAKRIVSFFSPVQLKMFIAVWILISAIAM